MIGDYIKTTCTIVGNVEFVHSQYSCILSSTLFMCPTKLLEIVIILKGVFAKNERGYRLNAIKKRF